MTFTLEDAENLKQDAQTQEKFVNDTVSTPNPGHPNGTVTSRQGSTYKNLASLSADVQNLPTGRYSIVGNFTTVALLLADNARLAYDTSRTVQVSTGDLVQGGQWLFEVAASGASDQHETTTGGVKLYEAGDKYSSLQRLIDAVNRGVAFVVNESVLVGQGWYAFTDNPADTTIPGLPRWKIVFDPTTGLGTAAFKNTGVSADQIPLLDSQARLPAVDGSQLTGLAAAIPQQRRAVSLPTPVQGSSGSDSAGLIVADNTLRIWGGGDDNQLGNGGTASRGVPLIPPIGVDLSESVSITKWIRSYRSNMVLLSNGEVYVWGENSSGALGTGDLLNQPIPIKIAALDGINIIDIAMGSFDLVSVATQLHSLFLADDGRIFSCGRNNGGQLGLGDNTDRQTPVALTKTDWEQIYAVGAGAAGCSFGVDSAGDLYSWGENGAGQLGQGNTTDLNTPTAVNAFGGGEIADLVGASGDSPSSTGTQYRVSVMCRLSTGEVYTWGSNQNGQLGQGNTTNLTAPIQVASLGSDNSILYACGGGRASFYVVKNGYSNILSCGNNEDGQMGNGSTSDLQSFAAVPNVVRSGASIVQALALGCSNEASFAVLYDDGVIMACGHNADGRLGLGHSTQIVSSLARVLLPAKKNPTQIGVTGHGTNTALTIITEAGEYYQSGYTSGVGGQLLGTENLSNIPIPAVI